MLVVATNNPPPDCLLDSIIDGFDLIDRAHFQTFLYLFKRHAKCVFHKTAIQRPDFCVRLIDRLLLKHPAFPKATNAILGSLVSQMMSSSELAQQWSSAYPDCNMKLLVKGLTLFSKNNAPKYQSWSRQNSAFEKEFVRIRGVEITRHTENRPNARRLTMTSFASDKTNFTASFFVNAHRILNQVQTDVTFSKSVCSCARKFASERFLVATSYFLRRRELLVTSEYPFDVSHSASLPAVSVLGDSLYPSRRVDRSPMIYQLPPFTSKSSAELAEMPVVEPYLPMFPSQIRGLLSAPYLQFEDFAIHTKRQLKLRFSLILPLHPSWRLSLLQLLLNGGRKFESAYNVSFLYGVDPVVGVVFKSAQNMIFLEGFKVTENGMGYAIGDTPRLLYAFYMSYFVAGYFGPCSLFTGHPCVRWPIDQVLHCSQRSWLQKPSTVELVFCAGWKFILIPEPKQFQSFFGLWKKFVDDTLTKLPKPTSGFSPLHSAYLLKRKDHTKLWTEGQIDNFTYLCLLNCSGGRSLSDYTQYFVFPWIVADYRRNSHPSDDGAFRDLRRPMGQLGVERARRFEAVFRDSEGQYFYGTHYMHLGVLLYYMFRLEPFCLFSFQLHRGWDHQNRLFYDVYESWMAAGFTSPADVKELIPEFYCLPDFLYNSGHLPLTTTTEGRTVADVALGQWVTNPFEFVRTKQHFLQSEFVSRNLQHWIDLIFGYKSRGEAAVEAKNLFHPLCYTQTTDDDDDRDWLEKEATKTYIINFGQCCSQVFKAQHPSITKQFSRNHIMTNPELVCVMGLNPAAFQFPITDLRIRHKMICSTTGTSFFLPVGELSLDSSLTVKNRQIIGGDFLLSASSICSSKEGMFLAIGQVEGSIALYFLSYNSSSELVDATFIERFITNGTVNFCQISSPHFLLLAVTNERINRIDIGARRVLQPIDAEFRVNCLQVEDYSGLIVVAGYSSLAVWTVSGQKLCQSPVESSVLSVAVPDLPESVENRFFVTGHAAGIVKFWRIDYRTMTLVAMKTVKLSQMMVKKLAVDEAALRVVAATTDEVYCLDFMGSGAPRLEKTYAIECAECGTPLAQQKVRVCAHCHKFFCGGCFPKDQLFAGREAKRKKKCQNCTNLTETNTS
jgi:hypothetical protein